MHVHAHVCEHASMSFLSQYQFHICCGICRFMLISATSLYVVLNKDYIAIAYCLFILKLHKNSAVLS